MNVESKSLLRCRLSCISNSKPLHFCKAYMAFMVQVIFRVKIIWQSNIDHFQMTKTPNKRRKVFVKHVCEILCLKLWTFQMLKSGSCRPFTCNTYLSGGFIACQSNTHGESCQCKERGLFSGSGNKQVQVELRLLKHVWEVKLFGRQTGRSRYASSWNMFSEHTISCSLNWF